MKAMSRSICGSVALAALATVAAAQVDPTCTTNQDELVIVEPLNVSVVNTTNPNLGAQLMVAMSPVPCGLPSGFCYEFGVLPLTYSSLTSPPMIEEVGSLTNPITGSVQVQVLPLASTNPGDIPTFLSSPPTGTWNSTDWAKVFVDPGLSLTGPTPKGAKVQIDADFVQTAASLDGVVSTGGVVGVVNGIHTPTDGSKACGFFQIVKRNLAGNELLAKSMEASPTPILFTRQTGGTNRAIVVEPLHSQFVGIASPVNVGVQTLIVTAPVKVPANLCGGDSTDTTPTSCYEFAMTYVTYDTQGRQTIHLPNPNSSDPSQQPIVGALEAELLPLSTQTVGPVFNSPVGFWDGTTTNNPGEVFVSYQAPPLEVSPSPPLAKIRIPASRVQAMIPSTGGLPGGVLALIRGHQIENNLDSWAFFNLFKRNMVFNQDVANAFQATVTPVFLLSEPQGADDREVVLVEPLDLTTASVPGVGLQLPVAKCVNVVLNGIPTDVYQFGVTYIDYDVGPVNVHTAFGASAISGTVKVAISGGSVPPVSVAPQTWDGSHTGNLSADVTADTSLTYRSYNVPRLFITKAAVMAMPTLPGGQFVYGLITGQHVNGTAISQGFYNNLKKNFAHNQAIANQLDQAPTPVLFEVTGTCTPVS